eukprot:jgi/Chrzof1/13406/Cz07g31240.t1
MFAPGQVIADFEALSKLFDTPAQVVNYNANNTEVSKPSTTPASIGAKDLLPVQVAAPKVYDNKDIWHRDDVADGQDDNVDDGRQLPSYEFIYKQAVESTDAFLGMSGKDPSSTCCEDLVVRVELPEASSISELDLDVTATHMRLSSPTYKLSLPLPHKVADQKGKAKWDDKKKVLTVTLPIIREDLF